MPHAAGSADARRFPSGYDFGSVKPLTRALSIGAIGWKLLRFVALARWVGFSMTAAVPVPPIKKFSSLMPANREASIAVTPIKAAAARLRLRKRLLSVRLVPGS